MKKLDPWEATKLLIKGKKRPQKVVELAHQGLHKHLEVYKWVELISTPLSPFNISSSKSSNILQLDTLKKTRRLMELVSQKLGEKNEPDVAPKEVKSCHRAFFDMIYLLLEGMPEGKVKDMSNQTRFPSAYS